MIIWGGIPVKQFTISVAFHEYAPAVIKTIFLGMFTNQKEEQKYSCVINFNKVITTKRNV